MGARRDVAGFVKGGGVDLFFCLDLDTRIEAHEGYQAGDASSGLHGPRQDRKSVV